MRQLSQLSAAPMRAVISALAPAGARSRLSTLIFHRVLEAPDPLHPGEVTNGDFERLLRWCQQLFNVVPVSDAVAGLRNGRLPERPLVITFDDGYADNHDRAAPILRKLGLPATFFIATGYLDGGRMFNDDIAAAVAGCSAPTLDLSTLGLGCHSLATDADRRNALERLLPAVKVMPLAKRNEVVERIFRLAEVPLPRSLMMSSSQVAALQQQGFEIGAHTDMHPILARMGTTEGRDEIERGRARLADIIGAPVRFFAYPNGRPGEDFTPLTVQLVRESGFEAAFCTAPGVATFGTDLFQLPRFTPWDRSPLRFGLRMILNLTKTRSLTAEAALAIDGRPPVTA